MVHFTHERHNRSSVFEVFEVFEYVKDPRSHFGSSTYYLLKLGDNDIGDNTI